MAGHYPEARARAFPSTRWHGATILRLVDAVFHPFAGPLRDPSFSGGKKFRPKNDFSLLGNVLHFFHLSTLLNALKHFAHAGRRNADRIGDLRERHAE